MYTAAMPSGGPPAVAWRSPRQTRHSVAAPRRSRRLSAELTEAATSVKFRIVSDAKRRMSASVAIESEYRSAGSLATTVVPEPCRRFTRRADSNSASAWRTGDRLTWNRSHSSNSVGSFVPTRYLASARSALRVSATLEYRVPGPSSESAVFRDERRRPTVAAGAFDAGTATP